MESMAETYETDLNLRATELRLGLPGTDSPEKSTTPPAPRGNKRALAGEECRSKSDPMDDKKESGNEPPTKAQIVGWPPVRSFMKNSLQTRKLKAETTMIYVKVSMDGAPYLRKIDLKVYKNYPELLKALKDMFKCFNIGQFSDKEGYNGSEYAITYEDKDGDWMLVGDVPWDMFISSCKRLRIMKGAEARGLGSDV
ncbi:hypothetical protein MRB53_020415 [Persea americana]|uniref:Uncharacterized protein n=1 Tax=Persea americana TaxID=3435 RepID=A0ACC2L174_PERAE|nr:hypothetical protein MRB53_020415 [Persea americana]